MISVEQIHRLLELQGHQAVEADKEALAVFRSVTSNPDIAEYLRLCTPDEIVQLGEIRLHSLDRIEAEIASGARPGPTIFRFGHIPIASTVGGQLICVSETDGRVRWADGSYICDEYLCYFDGSRLQEFDVTSENLVRIMPDVTTDLLELFQGVESGEIDTRITQLDLG